MVEAFDRFLEAVAADEPHGIERPAILVVPQAVDRHDAGMLEPTGDLGLEKEAGTALRVVAVAVPDLLDRHLAVQLHVLGDENLAEPSLGMEPQDPEPRAGRTGPVNV